MSADPAPGTSPGTVPRLGTVLLVTPYFPPHLGGVERYVANLATSLLQYGHARRVVVATTGLGGVVEGPVTGVPGLTVRLLGSGPMISSTPVPQGWLGRLRRIIAEEDPDVVNAHAPVPLLSDIARLATQGRPFVLTYHAGRLLKGRVALDLVLRAYEAVVLRHTAGRSDAVICSSEAVRDAMGWRLPGAGHVITPGVTPEWLAPAAPMGVPEAMAGPGHAARRAVFVGTLQPETRYKGLDDLLAALDELQDTGRPVGLDVVGDGDDRERYERLVQDLGLGDLVRFRGALHGQTLIRAYRGASMMVLPTHFDSTPTVLVEAMASGLPVVSTRVGGVPEAVQEGVTGLLVPAGDVSALAAAIRRLDQDPDLAARFGSAAREVVEHGLTWEHQAAATVDVFTRALQRFGARPEVRASRSTGSTGSTGSTRPRPRIRLAVVTAYYAPHIGGVETYTQQLVRAAVASADVDVTVITAATGWRTVVDVVDGAPVVRLGSWLRLSNTPINPLWPLVVVRLLRRHRIDVVNAHAPVPFLPDVAVAVAGHRPTILTYHAGTMVKGAHWSDRLLAAYERHVLPVLFRRATALVAVSRTSLAAASPDVQVINPGVDLDRFTPGPEQDSGATTPAAPTLLYVGRIESTSAWKGVNVLLAAFALVHEQVPAAQLTLVGDGDAVEEHRQLAERLGVAAAVRFTGPLRGDDLVAAYRGASLVVLPSLTAAESFGLVLIESMACGRPVVGSRVGGIPEVIDDGVTGLMVTPDDPKELALACLRIIEDPAFGRRLGAAGRQAVTERWSWERGSEAALALVRKLAGREPPVSRGRPV